MAKSHLALVAPAIVIGTVGPRRPPKRVRNAEVRAREYLTNAEVDRLMKAAGVNRNGHRDATMVLLAFWTTSLAACVAALAAWRCWRRRAPPRTLLGAGGRPLNQVPKVEPES
jgi:hypothetical protein